MQRFPSYDVGEIVDKSKSHDCAWHNREKHPQLYDPSLRLCVRVCLPAWVGGWVFLRLLGRAGIGLPNMSDEPAGVCSDQRSIDMRSMQTF